MGSGAVPDGLTASTIAYMLQTAGDHLTELGELLLASNAREAEYERIIARLRAIPDEMQAEYMSMEGLDYPPEPPSTALGLLAGVRNRMDTVS